MGVVMSATERQPNRSLRLVDRDAGPLARGVSHDDALIAEFQEFLDSRLRPLEQAAAVTAGEIGVEAERIRARLAAGNGSAERIEELAERLARSAATFAEDVARMRTAIGSPMASREGAPSEGVELLVRQMMVAGADAEEIESRLADLGVERPREAIERILSKGP